MNRSVESRNGARRVASMDAAASASVRPEDVFAQRVCRALDDLSQSLPSATLERLATARKAALRAQATPPMRLAPAAELASAGLGADRGTRFGFGRAGLVFSSIALVGACLAGLYQFEQQRRVEDLADVDSAVLNDELPISVYADHGFNAFIKQNP